MTLKLSAFGPSKGSQRTDSILTSREVHGKSRAVCGRTRAGKTAWSDLFYDVWVSVFQEHFCFEHVDTKSLLGGRVLRTEVGSFSTSHHHVTGKHRCAVLFLMRVKVASIVTRFTEPSSFVAQL